VVNGLASDMWPILSGIPQSSVFGHLLFPIYINRIKTSPRPSLLGAVEQLLLKAH